MEEVKIKQIYWHLVSTINQRATSEKKWNEKIEFEIDEPMWNLIYTNDSYLTKDTTLTNFQFKITHRILACNYNLKIWNMKETNIYMQPM